MFDIETRFLKSENMFEHETCLEKKHHLESAFLNTKHGLQQNTIWEDENMFEHETCLKNKHNLENINLLEHETWLTAKHSFWKIRICLNTKHDWKRNAIWNV